MHYVKKVFFIGLSVKAGMGNRERNGENDRNAGNQGGNDMNAVTQCGNAGNQGENAGEVKVGIRGI